MKYILLLTIVSACSLVSSTTFAQTWCKHYDVGNGVSENNARGVVYLSNQTYYTLDQDRFTNENKYAGVQLISSSGTVSWHRRVTMNTSTAYENTGNDIAVTADGHNITCGRSGNNNEEVWFVTSRAASGGTNWSRQLEAQAAIWGNEGMAIAGTADSGAVSAGIYNDFGILKPLFWRLQDNGADVFVSMVNGISNFKITDIVETPDTGYVMMGTTNQYGAGGDDIFAIKVDGIGNLVWARTYGTSGNDMANSVILNSTNQLIVVGTLDSSGTTGKDEILLLELDLDGLLLTSQVYGDTSKDLYGSDIAESDLGYMIAYHEYSTNRQIGVLHADNAYNSIWHYEYGSLATTEDFPFIAYTNHDNGFAIYANYGNASIMFKGDSTGFTDHCNQFNTAPFGQYNGSIQVVDISSSLSTTILASPNTSALPNFSFTSSVGIVDYHFIVDTSQTNVSCEGFTDGTASSLVTFNGSTLTHSWSTGQTDVGVSNSQITGLTPGNYTYTVTDLGGCTYNTSFTITEPDSLQVMVNGLPSQCHSQPMGAAWAVPSAGTPPYFYLWNTGSVLDTLSGIGVGNYSVTVTDNKGCMAAGNYVVSEATALTASISVVDVVCPGDSSGSYNAIPTGGTAPFTYNWSDGTNNAANTNVPAGNYVLTMLDSCGAIFTDSIIITEPDSLAATIQVSNVLCHGGASASALATTSNGVNPYTYNWSNSTSTTNAASTLQATSGMFDTLTIVDVCLDTIQLTFVVSEPDLLAVTVGTQDASCSGGGDGQAYADVQGGTQPYNYLWNIIQTTDTVNNLFPATYTVNVTDANGCFTTNSGVVGSPQAISAQFNSSGAHCNGSDGWISATLSGGTQPYSYAWSNADSDSLANNLVAGYYSLMVTDNNGCITFFDSTEIGELLSIVDPVDLCMVTVDTSSNKNMLVWAQSSGPSIQGYNIYRNVSGTYVLQAFWPVDSLSQWVDYTFGVDPMITSYRYKISAVDSCGNESALSAHHETIHLTTNLGQGNDYNLVWDDYEGFPYTHYRILWDSLSNGNWQVVDSVPNTNFTYTHTTVAANPTYTIEVVIPNICESTRASHNTTRSNRTQPSNGGSTNSIQNERHRMAKPLLYPNPNNGSFQVEFFSPANTVGHWQIIDTQGRVVHQVTSNVDHGRNLVDVQATGLKPGVYALRTVVNDQLATTRLVIH